MNLENSTREDNEKMKRLNITKEQFEKSRYFKDKYGTLKYVSESGKLFKTSKGQVLKFNESDEDKEQFKKQEVGVYDEGVKDSIKSGWNKVKQGAKAVGKAIGDTFKGPFRKGDHIVMKGEDGEQFKGTIKGFDLSEQTYQVLLGNAVNESFDSEYDEGDEEWIAGVPDLGDAVYFQGCRIPKQDIYMELYDCGVDCYDDAGFDEYCKSNQEKVYGLLSDMCSAYPVNESSDYQQRYDAAAEEARTLSDKEIELWIDDIIDAHYGKEMCRMSNTEMYMDDFIADLEGTDPEFDALMAEKKVRKSKMNEGLEEDIQEMPDRIDELEHNIEIAWAELDHEVGRNSTVTRVVADLIRNYVELEKLKPGRVSHHDFGSPVR